MRVLVIGAGGVGLGLGAFLINAGENVTFLATQRTKQTLKKGFRVFGIFGDFIFESNQYEVIENYNDIYNYDWVLITAKTNANDSVANQLCNIKERLKRSKLAVIQNGWGNVEKYLTCFDRSQVFAGRIITGFFRHNLNEVEITVHADKLIIGNYICKEKTNEAEELVFALNRGGFDAALSEDVDKYLWAKMLYNCALNPLGAVLGVAYGDLAEHPHTKKLMDGILDEAFEVMHKSGFSTFFDDVESYKEVFYSKLVPTTAKHKSSMLQDIQNSKQTEIDSLNGQIVDLGKKHSIDTPYNEFIVGLIKFLEAKNSRL